MENNVFGGLTSCSLRDTNILEESAASAGKRSRHSATRQHGAIYPKLCRELKNYYEVGRSFE
jgi:hypothetical protein